MTLAVKGVSLMVLGAWDRDEGRGVVRVDTGPMEEMGALVGDILEVLGRRRTVARCLPLSDPRTDADHVSVGGSSQPAESGVARMDRVNRGNAKVSVGETVTLRRVQALPANYVEVMSLAEPPSVDARYIELALNGVPVSPGDVVMIPKAESAGRERYFKVISLEPSTEQAILTVSTIFRTVARAGEE